MRQLTSAALSAVHPARLGRPDEPHRKVPEAAHWSTARIADAHAVVRTASHSATQSVEGIGQVASPRAHTPAQVAALGGCCVGVGAGGLRTQA